MHLRNKWRRHLCSERWLAKLPPQLYQSRNFQRFVAAKMAKAFGMGAAIGALSLIVITVAFSTSKAQAIINPPKPAPMKQVRDTGERDAKKLPIAYADDIVTLSFHNCRENAKGHWSCQRIDGDDTDHFVYIPGLHPTHTRVSSFAVDPGKEGPK